MASPEAFTASINRTEYLPDGTQVTVKSAVKERPKTSISKVTRHETYHAVAAEMGRKGTKVQLVTIIPGPGYLGLTRTDVPDATAAAASAELDGNGHDMNIVDALGASRSAVASEAKGIIKENDDIVEAVGSELEIRQELSGHEVRNIISKTLEDRENPTMEVELFISGANINEKVLFNAKANDIKDKLPVEKLVTQRDLELAG